MNLWSLLSDSPGSALLDMRVLPQRCVGMEERKDSKRNIYSFWNASAPLYA